MSVVAWNGVSIAADKRSVSCGLIRTTTKLTELPDKTVLAFVGGHTEGLTLIEWYKNGADVTKYPAFQGSEDYSRLIVVRNLACYLYESQPYPIPVEDEYCAWGSGRDYAMAAMYLGKSPAEAVAIASHFDNSCGNGVTNIKL